jgi:hypothetical protein
MLTDVSEVCATSIIRAIMEAARTSETSVDIQLRTWQYISEDSELHTCHHENLKPHKSLEDVQKFKYLENSTTGSKLYVQRD